MKASTLLSIVAMATGSFATFGDSPDKGDDSSITDLITKVSGAMSQLDTSMKDFDGSDASKVKSDTEQLVSTIKECSSSLKDSIKEISLDEISGLQPVMADITTIGKSLADDFQKKKTEFEQSELCTKIQDGIQKIGKEAKKLMEGVVGKCPQEAKSVASSLGDGVVSTLTNGADLFKGFHCQPNGGSKHEKPSSYPVAGPTASSPPIIAPPPAESAVTPPPAESCVAPPPVTVTATVTEPCACSSPVAPPPPPPPAQTTKSSAAPPYPTGAPPATTVPGSTGGIVPTPTGVPVVTAAAVPNAMAPMGVVAGLFALLL